MNFRRVLTTAAIGTVACILVGQLRTLLDDPTIWPPDDFVEYWAAARLTLDGKNPYDPQLLLPLQQAAGRKTDEAIMMWNPPWSLAVVLPLGLLPARIAQLIWLAANLLAIGYCGDRLWLLLGGSSTRRWVGWLLVLIALPTAFALQSGQIGPLLLLGGVLFLECHKRGWPILAGAATVLLAIKPHLAYLVWLAILFDSVANRRLRMLVGGAAAGLVCTAIGFVFDHQLLAQYLDAMGNRPPAQWVSPTLGTILRLAFGEELFRLQFVPVLAGCLWFVWHWRNCVIHSSGIVVRNSDRLCSSPNDEGRSPEDDRWNWNEQLPLLLLVSFVTAPYGAWPFDMVLLLPAVFWLVLTTPSPARRYVVAGLAAVNAGCLMLNLLGITSVWFLWVSPAVLGLYIFANHRRNPERLLVAPASSPDCTLVTA